MKRMLLCKMLALALALIMIAAALSACTSSSVPEAPSASPSASASVTPSASPSSVPTETPTKMPTDTPSVKPTDAPTSEAEISASPEASASSAPANPMVSETPPAITVEEEKGPLDGVIVGIDPGHQAHGNSEKEPVSPGSTETKAKVSSGTQGVKTRIPEYEVNLQVGLLLRDALEAQGATVYMTRESNDVDISNVERATMMNELGANIVLRLHCNGSTNQSVSGIGLYVKSSGDGAEESYAICEPLIKAMGEATGARTEDIHVRDIYSGLNWSTVPSILVEMGYMSNAEEDERLCSDEYQCLLVEGMVQGLIDYYDVHPVSQPLSESLTAKESAAPTPSAAPASQDEY